MKKKKEYSAEKIVKDIKKLLFQTHTIKEKKDCMPLKYTGQDISIPYLLATNLSIKKTFSDEYSVEKIKEQGEDGILERVLLSLYQLGYEAGYQRQEEDYEPLKSIMEKVFENSINEGLNLKTEHKEIINLIKDFLSAKGGKEQRFTQALFNLDILQFASPTSPDSKDYLYRNNYNDQDTVVISKIKESLEKFGEKE